MNEVIRARKLTKFYGTPPNQIKVLDGVDLDIFRGDFCSIMGPSGSGKTTLLNILGLLDRPTQGDLWILGRDTSNLSDGELSRLRREAIGFVFQLHNLIPTLNALENVMLPGIYYYRDKSKLKSRALELLEAVGLSHRISHKPSQMSGGERQRVSIARALINDPALVLADEPTGNLDSSTKLELMELILELNSQRGQSFLIVTHDPEVAGYTRMRYRLRDGKLHLAQ